MIQISKYQLFAMLVVFQLGSTIIFGFAASAGRDAWITTIISTILGALIVLLYMLIYKLSGGLTLVEWFPALLGKWVGIPLAWLFPLIFIYDGARMVTDIRFLFPVTILHATPNWVIGVSFLLVVVYALFAGLEVMSRLATLFLPIILFTMTLEVFLLLFSNRIHLANLLPAAGEGWERIWKGVWPLGLMQTYGESIEFAMFWVYVKNQKRLSWTIVGACLVSGAFITLLDVLDVACMGEGVFRQMMYPSFSLLKLSNIADLLENLDAIGVMYLMLTAFSKLSLHLFAALFCLRKLLSVQDERKFIVPVALLSLLVSMTMAVSFSGHLQVATFVLPFRIWLPLFLFLPLMLLPFAFFKKWRKGVQT